MKNILLIAFLFISAFGFSQEGVSVKGNRLSTREIAPVWPGCNGSEKDKKICFNEKLIQCMKENYKFPRDAKGDFIRGKAVVTFNVNEKGKVDILKVEGPKEALNKEAKRIIGLLPEMKPGHLAGKPIAVKYTVPFTF